MNNKWVPEAGDIVLVDFNSAVGHEQGGERPAVVLTPENANRVLGICTIVPVTRQVKHYPFEVTLPGNCACEVSGVVLCDQIKTIDWVVRNIRKAGTVPGNIFEEIRDKIRTLLCL